MKTLFVASLLAFAACTASAQSASDGNTVTINGNQGAAIALPATPYTVTAQEFGKYIGSYALSNGGSIALFVRAGLKYASLDGGIAHSLVAKSGNSFVARDRQLAVTINLHDNGEASGEVLTAAPVDKVAGGAAQQKVVSIAFH